MPCSGQRVVVNKMIQRMNDIKCRCRSLRDLERILEILALEISSEYKKNQKSTNQQPQLKRAKVKA